MLPDWLAKYMPPRRRRLEVIIQVLLLFGLVGGGVYLQFQDHKLFVSYKDLQEQMFQMIEAKSQTGITGELISYIVACMDNKTKYRLAYNLLQMTADRASPADQMKMIASSLGDNCQDFLKEAGIDPQTLVNKQMILANQQNFTDAIKVGFQYYYDGYSEAAARNWYQAMALLPGDYVKNGLISMKKIDQARADFEAKEYDRAADEFKLEFEKVVR